MLTIQSFIHSFIRSLGPLFGLWLYSEIKFNSSLFASLSNFIALLLTLSPCLYLYLARAKTFETDRRLTASLESSLPRKMGVEHLERLAKCPCKS